MSGGLIADRMDKIMVLTSRMVDEWIDRWIDRWMDSLVD